MVCEWVMSARLGAVSGGSALRCLSAAQIRATSPPAIAPTLRATRSTDEANPRINNFVRAWESVLADPHRGALVLVGPSAP